MMTLLGRILAILAVYSVLAPISSGHCGHWVENYPECEALEFVFCDGNFTKCGNSTEGLTGNCTAQACDPNSDDVISALNGTEHEGNHTEGSATSSGLGSVQAFQSGVGSLGVLAWLFLSV
jgi:hypothetical protein